MKQLTATALITLTLLLTGCQSALDSMGLASLFAAPARPVTPPRSHLVEVRHLTTDDTAPGCCAVGHRLRAAAGESYLIRTRHHGPQQLQSIEVRLNHQPLTTANEQSPAFPGSLAQVRVCQWPRGLGPARLYPARPTNWACGEDLQITPQESILVDWPSRSEEVALLWRGNVPGSYRLQISAIDAEGDRGNTITQHIEVTAP
ncbi:MAG: hypothetical protein Kow0031_18860 [Anaerolineae bacterium]